VEIHGRCHCGYLSFEATADPNNVAICHCTDCQTLSGTAFRTAVRIPNTDEWGDGLQNLVTPCLLFASILSIRRQAPSYERDNAHRR